MGNSNCHRTECRLLAAGMPPENLQHRCLQIVVADAVGYPAKKREGLHVAHQECFLALREQGHHEHAPRIAQAHVEQLHRHPFTGDLRHAFAPVDLRVPAGIELQRQIHLGPPLRFPLSGDVCPHCGAATSVALVFQDIANALAGVALLAGPRPAPVLGPYIARIDELLAEKWWTSYARILTEWIYQYIWADKRAGGDLHTHLRRRKKYRKRSGGGDNRGKIPNRVSIEQRPAIVDARKRLGDWEGDTVAGKGRKQYLVTLTERKSRFTLFKKVNSKRASEVKDAVIELLAPYWEKVKTITFDNGKEFADHAYIAQELNADIYFAHPYASWERGTNENANGLIRQYFPKNSNLSDATQEKISLVHGRLNDRPRKCLDYQTPKMVFFEFCDVALDT